MSDEVFLALDDEEVTAAALTALIDARIGERRAALGAVRRHFPSFGHVAEMPALEDGRFAAPNLAYHLRQANAMPPAPAEPQLAPSPATGLPLLGRLWRLVRAQFHSAILFYVNRAAAHQAQLNNHLVSVLNEQTRLIQAQQAAIADLQARVAALEEQQNEE